MLVKSFLFVLFVACLADEESRRKRQDGGPAPQLPDNSISLYRVSIPNSRGVEIFGSALKLPVQVITTIVSHAVPVLITDEKGQEAMPALEDVLEEEDEEITARSCKANEEFTACSPVCPKTCDSPETPEHCPFVCQPGCDCKFPRLRNHHGECVLPSECDLYVKSVEE